MTFIREPNRREQEILKRAAAVTKSQVALAVEIVQSELRNDQRGPQPEILAAVIQALATNYRGQIADLDANEEIG